MTRFGLTRKAVSDLKGIARYTEERWGRAQRDQYLKELDGAFHYLAENPRAGRECSEIRSGYRRQRHAQHVIFYRLNTDNAPEIIRILHASMDVDVHFPR